MTEASSESERLDQQSIAAFAEMLASSGIYLVRAESFSGPLPSPKALEEYKKTAPELLNLIIKEYSEEGPHRRKNEDRLIANGILMARLGLLSAFLITVLFLAAGFYLILHGHDAAGAAICGAGLVSVVVAFLRHTSNRN
ncbi:MAG: hypothetical protein L0229_18870 [Blastocatellia bacterium]|nr:hypothetical protein [Blastocatellia bacterium]